ncbi:MAG: glycoside hydrolase N-terminal domain-containing protein [Luteolibacter sp.]
MEEQAFPLGDNNSPVWRVHGDPKKERIVRQSSTISIKWLDADQPLEDYRRSLDLDTGVATATWKRGGSHFTLTELADLADGVLLVHLLTDMPGSLGFRVQFENVAGAPTGNRGELNCEGIRLCVLPFESEVESDDKAMQVRGEGEALIVISAGAGSLATLAAKYDPGAEHPDATKLWTKALEAHTAVHRARMGDCVIDLGGHEAAAKPTDERLKVTNWEASDPDLAELMDRYARYSAALCLPPPEKSSFLEHLIDDQNDTVVLLPALPPAWKDGSAKNLPLGGILPTELKLDMTWKDGRVTDYSIRRVAGKGPGKIRVRVNGGEQEISVR